VVGICTLAYIFSFIDRQILSLLVGPIKLDLGLTDTSFAFLHGFAFSIFYATLGVPIAGLADRMARPLVIAGGIALWSLATAACGLASGFSELLLARMMVGAGGGALARRLCADQRPVPARKAGAGNRGLFARFLSGGRAGAAGRRGARRDGGQQQCGDGGHVVAARVADVFSGGRVARAAAGRAGVADGP
jgi:MFS family permease